MTALLISCFQWYKGRVEYVEKYLREREFDIQVWMSDFDHIKKERINSIEGCNYVPVRAYKRNLSVARMCSHFGFSKQIFSLLMEQKPDLVYALVPPNSVAWACAKYKKQNPESKLIFDVIDMWPESYPAHKLLDAPFNIWRGLRDNNLKYADLVFTECELYQRYLKTVSHKKLSALYLCREESAFSKMPELDGKTIRIAYLGSINNIIDIPAIESFISSVSKFFDVNVHIVGGGQSKDEFVEALKRANATVDDHGVIFDKQTMRSVIGECHFALNVMKPSVCVGLTIKSMDYFQMGVPIINTIKGDTRDIIESYQCGYNLGASDVAEKISQMSINEYRKMRNNTQKAFLDLFTVDRFQQNLQQALSGII